jgi:hypothetical protein
MQQTLQRPFSLHIASVIWYLNIRLLQKHGQEYQPTSPISMSTAQFRIRFFISKWRYVKQEEQILLPFSNQKAKELAVFQGITTSLPTGEWFGTRMVQLVREHWRERPSRCGFLVPVESYSEKLEYQLRIRHCLRTLCYKVPSCRMGVMTRMVTCFNQKSEWKKERVREGTRVLTLGPRMMTWPRYSKGRDGSEVCR